MLFVSSVGPPSSDGTAGPVALGSLEVDGKLGHCPKPLEPFDGELCFVEASPSGSFVFGLTADGLCVLWNTNIAQKPADSSTIAHASSNKSAPSGVPLLDTGQPAINCTRTFWLPVVTFPLDTPPRFGPDMGHPIVEDPSTSALSPVAAASVGSPLNSIRRAFSRGLFSHKRRGLGFYQPNSPPILSRVHWARVSDDGARVVVSASPKAVSYPMIIAALSSSLCH